MRCEKSGLVCGGWRKFPVFINRTASGLEKRKYLDEIKGVQKNGNRLVTPSQQAQAILTPRVSTKPTEHAYYISWFWSAFAPTEHSASSPSRNSRWMCEILRLTSPLPALEAALSAVSLTRFGRTFGDESVLRQGHESYSKSVVLLRQALPGAASVANEQVLATVCVLSLYEMFECTTDNFDGLILHMNAAVKLLELGGPKFDNRILPRVLFEHCRGLLALYSLRWEEAPAICQREWLEQPWLHHEKDVEQRLYDITLLVPALIHKLRSLQERGPSRQKLMALLTECVDLIGELNEFQIANLALRENIQSLEPTIYRMTALVIIMITIQIGFSICTTLTKLFGSSIIPSTAIGSAFTQTASHALKVAETLRSNQTACRADILMLAEKCLSSGLCLQRANRLIVPIRYAMDQLQPDDPQFAEFRRILTKIAGFGFRIAMVQT